MTTWTITFILFTVLTFLIWIFLMYKLKPSRQYHDETRWEANIREGGFIALWYFILIAFLASIGAARIILWFMFLEK